MAKGGNLGHLDLASRHLDIEVATRVMGYRWVEWNHAALRGAPLDEPGRFLARPDDPTSHLQQSADPATPLSRSPLRRVPPYSRTVENALAAAVAAGVFTAGSGALSRDGGDWLVHLRATDDRFTGGEVAAVLCNAAVHMASRGRGHR